jgi:hypothetical protein
MKIRVFSSLGLPFFTILLLFQEFFVSDAYAYLDPGTGSVVIQAMIGALVGVGITLKVYWEKIKYKISSKRIKSNDE